MRRYAAYVSLAVFIGLTVAGLCLDEFRRKYPSLNYYSDMLRFVTAADAHDGVNTAVFTSVDHFCKKMLKIGET